MRKIDHLRLCCLDRDQHDRTCGYWYTVTTFGGTPHTAFRTREALTAWLANRGLTLSQDLPEERGTWQSQPITGEYFECYVSTAGDMPRGRKILKLSNAEYTVAALSEHEGRVAVSVINVNSPRPVFDYNAAREHEDAGRDGLPSALLTERPFGKGVCPIPA